MANKIKKNDEVIVISGKDKGRKGLVKNVVVDLNKKVTHVIVEGLRLLKKTKKPNPQAGEKGGIVEQEAAIAISSVAIFNPLTKKQDRVGFKVGADGKKQRIFRSNGEAVDLSK
jgi:large subunit ribosomal protein L24